MNAGEELPTFRFTYSFAKEFGLIVLQNSASPAVVGARGKPPAQALLEARRALGMPISIDEMPPEAFDRRLSEIYSVDAISGR